MTRAELLESLLCERFSTPLPQPRPQVTLASDAGDDDDLATARRRRELDDAIGQHEQQQRRGLA